MANLFSYNHLFVALSETTIKGIISDLEEFIRNWNDTSEACGYKEDYVKFLLKIVYFYEKCYLPSFNEFNKGDFDESLKTINSILDKLKKQKEKHLTNGK